jgi:hypothetical protein
LILEPERISGEDLLASKLSHVSIHGSSSYKAALDILHQAGIQINSHYIGQAPLYARINLELHNVTVREALDAIAKADGQVIWRFAPEDQEKRLGTFWLKSWRTSGITRFEEQLEKFPLWKRWLIALRLKLGLTPIDMTPPAEE